MRRFLASLALTAALSAPMAVGTVPTPALAQNIAANNLVNVQVGNVTILKNVSVAAAVQVLAQVCGNQIPVTALGTTTQAGNTFTDTCKATGETIAVAPVTPGR